MASGSFIDYVLAHLQRPGCTLKIIDLAETHTFTDAQFAGLMDWLLAHPNVIERLYLSGSQLTDETGVRLAQLVAASSTIETLTMSSNLFGEATYLAMADALRVNTSLSFLTLNDNLEVNWDRVCTAFANAFRENSHRPLGTFISLRGYNIVKLFYSVRWRFFVQGT